jgi:hypothetical protein
MENPQLTTLRSLVLQAKHNLESLEMEEPRVVRSRELLDAAVALVDEVIQTPAAAVAMGSKGGKATAKRMAKKDPDYYKRIAGMRKKRAGGRPKKTAE